MIYIKGILFNKYFLVFLVIILIFLYGLLYPLGDKYSIYGNKIIKSEQITNLLTQYSNKSLFFINRNELKEKIANISPYIKRVKVEKTTFFGIIITIQEYNIIAYIKLNNSNSYIAISEDEQILEKINENELIINIPIFELISNDYEKKIVIDYIKKILLFKSYIDKTKLKQNNNKIIYKFDIFGNLTLEVDDKLILRFDLNEVYYSLEDQVDVLSNIDINGLKEIDMRYKYLITK